MNISIVIVTFNRLEKLKKSLSCYENQTSDFSNLIVVDNCSTDGTHEWLEKWEQQSSSYSKHVLTMFENLGGSGGFYEGQKYALTLLPDWIYIADDDAYADIHMVELFKVFLNNHDCTKYSAICTSVLNMDNTYSLWHRTHMKVAGCKYYSRFIATEEEYAQEFFKIELLSYVGSFLNAQALKKVGLVDPRYFIFYDDSEHSLRLQKYGDIICVPSIKVVHEGGFGAKPEKRPIVTWGQYYEYRNQWHLLRRHFWGLGMNNFWIFFRHLWFYHIEKEPLRQVMKDAWKDAFFGRLGKHKKYVPGWKIEE